MDKTAAKWKQRFENAENSQQAMFTRVSKYYDIMYAVQNNSNVAPWRSKVFIPILASKAWDLVSRLSGVMPLFQTKVDEIELSEETGSFTVPEDVIARQQRLDAKLQKDYLDTDEPMKLKVSDTLLDAVVAGTGWAKVSWETKTKKTYSKSIDEQGMIKNPGKDNVEEADKGYNCFEPINFFNVFISPNAPSWSKANYIIVRYFKPFYELENNKNYNLTELFDKPKTISFDNQNNARNRIINEKQMFHNDDTVQTATIYECYERKADGVYLTTYAEGKGDNGWVQIRGEGKRYWHDYYPIVPFYIRRKTFSPWGESLFENNATLQSATNDIFNHYMDNLNVSLDSMIMYEDGTLTNDFIVEPGGEITFTGDAPKQFKFPEPNPAQLAQVMNMISGAVEQATVPQYISGVPDSSTDKTAGTAKGISLITEAATEKIGFMKDNFKQSMTIVGRIELSNLAQFQDKPEIVEYPKDGGRQPDVVMPADYQGQIGLTIDDDSMLPLTKDERRDMALGFLAQAGQIQKLAMEQSTFFGDKTGVPKFKYGEWFDELAQFYSSKDPQRFVDNKPSQTPAPTAPPPKVSISLKGDVPPQDIPNLIGQPAPQPNQPTGTQDPMMAAIQGTQSGDLGGLSAGNPGQ